MSSPGTYNSDQLRIIPHPSLSGHFLIESAQSIPLSPEELFPFYGDPLNLERITPPWLHFHVVTPLPIEMRQGITLDYRLRLHGIPLKWRSIISHWESPFRFVDEQLIGPYRKWHHEHLFESAPYGTRVVDRVTYAPPGGRWINRFFVQPDLFKIFHYRNQTLRQLLTPNDKSGAKRT